MLLDQHVTPEEYAETVQYLVSGIGRVVEYHRTKNKNDLLQGIKVFGEGSAIAGIEKILERELGAPVQHFENLAGVVIKGQAALTAEEVLRYLPNIGAVIKPIDLEVEYGESGGVNLGAGQTLKALIAVLIVEVIVMATWVTMVALDNKEASEEKARLEQEIADISDIEEIALAYEAAANEYIVVKAFEDSTHSDNEHLLQFILDMEQLLPTDTVVEDLEAVDGDVSFTLVSGWHDATKNEIADVIVTIGGLDYVNNLQIPSFQESYRVVLIAEYNEAGEPVFLTEEPEEGQTEGELITYDTHTDIPEEYMEYDWVTQIQTEYDFSCHIGYPEVEGEEEPVITLPTVSQATTGATTTTEGGAQ